MRYVECEEQIVFCSRSAVPSYSINYTEERTVGSEQRKSCIFLHIPHTAAQSSPPVLSLKSSSHVCRVSATPLCPPSITHVPPVPVVQPAHSPPFSHLRPHCCLGLYKLSLRILIKTLPDTLEVVQLHNTTHGPA